MGDLWNRIRLESISGKHCMSAFLQCPDIQSLQQQYMLCMLLYMRNYVMLHEANQSINRVGKSLTNCPLSQSSKAIAVRNITFKKNLYIFTDTMNDD